MQTFFLCLHLDILAMAPKSLHCFEIKQARYNYRPICNPFELDFVHNTRVKVPYCFYKINALKKKKKNTKNTLFFSSSSSSILPLENIVPGITEMLQ